MNKIEFSKLDAIHQFKVAEYLGHDLAYAWAYEKKLNSGLDFPVFFDRKKPISGYFLLKKVLFKDENETLIKSMNAFILRPRTINSDSYPIYIIWPGTHNWESFMANMERSPGEQTFREHEATLIKSLVEVFKLIETNVKKTKTFRIYINLVGHSLGSAYAQLCYHSLQLYLGLNLFKENPILHNKMLNLEDEFLSMLSQWVDLPKAYQKISQQQYVGAFIKNLESLNLLTWNSTGVLQVVAESSNQISTLLKHSHLQSNCFFGMVPKDIIHRTGQANILNDISSISAKIYVLKIDDHHAFKPQLLNKWMRLKFLQRLKESLRYFAGINILELNQYVKLLADKFPELKLSILFGQFINYGLNYSISIYLYHTTFYFNSEFKLSASIKLLQSDVKSDQSELQSLLKDKSPWADKLNYLSALACYGGNKARQMFMFSQFKKARSSIQLEQYTRQNTKLS